MLNTKEISYRKIVKMQRNVYRQLFSKSENPTKNLLKILRTSVRKLIRNTWGSCKHLERFSGQKKDNMLRSSASTKSRLRHLKIKIRSCWTGYKLSRSNGQLIEIIRNKLKL